MRIPRVAINRDAMIAIKNALFPIPLRIDPPIVQVARLTHRRLARAPLFAGILTGDRPDFAT
jgi:hypothetical protein